MHVYIYDGFLSHHKYAKALAKIETRLTDLGLNGKICRLGSIKNFQDLIIGEVRRGAKTIIAVGNDETLSRVINSTGGQEIPIGFIPIGKEKNSIAHFLGIENDMAACDILSARRLTKTDLGQANQYYFLTEAHINGKNTSIVLDKGYTIEAPSNALIKIINLPLSEEKKELSRFSPSDGQLELYIQTEESEGSVFKKKFKGESIFTSDKFYIENKNQQTVLLDNSVGITTPVEIKTAKQQVILIVGKNRSF